MASLDQPTHPRAATFASHAYHDFHLLMPLYVCRRWEGFVQPREGQALKWARAKDLRNYPAPPADAPLIPALVDLLGRGVSWASRGCANLRCVLGRFQQL